MKHIPLFPVKVTNTKWVGIVRMPVMILMQKNVVADKKKGKSLTTCFIVTFFLMY